MPEPEATPEFEATAADLSPHCPSPLHSAAPAVVPALQDTADILDAMSAQTNGVAHGGVDAFAPAPVVESAPTDPYAFAEPGDANGDNDDVDSLDDAYGEEEETDTVKVQEQQVEPDAGEDDYLKIFDSPPRDADEDGADQDDVSKAPESMHYSAASASLTSPAQGVPPPVADSSSARAAPVAADQSPTNPAPSTTATAHPGADSSAHNSTASIAESNARNDNAPEDDHAVDISRLVAEMTGQTSESSAGQSPAGSTQNHDAQSSSNLTPSASATLPPRPPMPQQTASTFPPEDYRAFHQQNGAPQAPSSMIAPPTPGQPSTYVSAGAPGAPGTTSDAFGGLPPPPATGLNATVPITSMTAPPHPNNVGHAAYQPDETTDRQKHWETFVNDERRYMADAKWDRFPDGSRIFIGNLSSERVSKRDVFDIFHKYGRLAQISLKSAYGFVQYHNLEDAQAAMDNLQGIEIKGRKIHLEISRAQKKKDGNERNRSPERGGRGGRQAGRQERQDGANSHHDNRRNRDDYRPGRSSPPRRNGGHAREDSHGGRDRYQHDALDRSRGRSRSPHGYGRQKDGYRRRTPSPPAFNRAAAADDRLDIPRRYGNQVPDVQFLLLQELSRDFIAWVQRGFTDRGLKVDVMFLHPSFPREAIIQRQVIEGVHAIVDLDVHAQNIGKIPIRVFDRSGGVSARYDDYRDIDPPIAAELVLRAKSQAIPAAAPYQNAPPPQPQYQGYGQPYGQSVPPHAPTYPGAQGPPRGPPPAQQPAVNPADLASLMSGIDNATLQRLLASMSSQGAGSVAANSAAGAASAQFHALMGGMQTAPPGAQTQPASYGGQAYAPNGQPPTSGHPAPVGTGDSAAQVENIMAQLARYRQ
ncbi:RNA recognition domain-containing protein [Colletotrichum graminicola M1.001]|uniref:RNA recognition domain-containing protein n=1 Tax=Colletotrichum graminicola (strain M1.001 / M2 / FGSC 10212) TaxID=645133 RepID=E3QLJ5_COLGM|nr:RNA recognition domain-containing protein [Colletotrichum graminicola M1.001]EFQ31733.1 RNA recognition domain-containing protein [Colletotrichum graminicola M1.001]